jgi:hypothetical protein
MRVLLKENLIVLIPESSYETQEMEDWRPDCCACAASGQGTIAPPTSRMNSRSRWRETRLAPASYGAWRDRMATPPAYRFTDLAGKRLELLREVVTRLRRLAILADVSSPAAMLEMGEVRAMAGTFGLELTTLEIRQAEDYRSSLGVAQWPR